jgi:outer membrane protein assembly factor BamD
VNYLLNALASHEVQVADYYYRRGAYLASIGRAQGALRQYPGASSQQRALILIVQSYAALGLTELQADAERVLRLNYPDSKSVKNP